MDVSKIDGNSVVILNWKKMTAQEILDKNEIGAQVPGEYLQWARQFLAEIEDGDNDDTTYEQAHSKGISSDKMKYKPSEDENKDVAITEDENKPKDGESTKSDAQKRKEATAGYLKELKTSGNALFLSNAKKKLKECNSSISTMEERKATSESDKAETQNSMENFFNEMEMLKSQISSTKDNKNSYGKANRLKSLKASLKNLGYAAHNLLASKKGELEEFIPEIDAHIQLNKDNAGFAKKFSIVASIQDGLLFRGFPIKAFQKTAQNLQEAADKGERTAENVKKLNADNISTLRKYTPEIAGKTGVSPSAAEDKRNGASDEQYNKFTSKDGVTASQNDGSDKSENAKMNLDEIVKAKLRRGQVDIEAERDQWRDLS